MRHSIIPPFLPLHTFKSTSILVSIVVGAHFVAGSALLTNSDVLSLLVVSKFVIPYISWFLGTILFLLCLETPALSMSRSDSSDFFCQNSRFTSGCINGALTANMATNCGSASQMVVQEPFHVIELTASLCAQTSAAAAAAPSPMERTHLVIAIALTNRPWESKNPIFSLLWLYLCQTKASVQGRVLTYRKSLICASRSI